MRTASLRRRVTLAAVAVLGAVLAALAIVVSALAHRVADRALGAVLTDHVQLAQQLAAQRVGPAELLRRVDTHGVHGYLVLADGQRYGRHARAGEPVRVRRVRLGGRGPVRGATLTLQLDTRVLARITAGTIRVGVVATLCGIAVVALGMPIAVRRALAPLDAMTALARGIARGRRGERLSPARTDTELGRTAVAFDEMLDALEGAEARARASEERTRRFVADAAHELRTPIAGIRAVAEAALHQPDNEQLHVLLVREARRAGRLVDDLLDLARIDAGLQLRRARTDLRELARAQVDRVGVLHPRVAIEVVGEPVQAVVDSTRIGQVLANLLDNACRAVADAADPAVTVRLRGTGDEVLIEVTDTGPGVPAADRERIFDRLVRLDDARDRADGSGLGLTIARGIARAHGGDLTCLPPETGCPGARFLLRLPH